jgi:putative transposase
MWFNIITQQAIRRGTFGSVKELVAKIEDFVRHCDAPPDLSLVSWVATADSILQKVQRLCEHVSRTRH